MVELGIYFWKLNLLDMYIFIWVFVNSYRVTQLCPHIVYTTSTNLTGYPFIIMLFVKPFEKQMGISENNLVNTPPKRAYLFLWGM